MAAAAPFDRPAALARGLDVRPSQVPGAGDGLWTARAFATGEVLCEYRGRVLSLPAVLRLSVRERDYVMGGFGLNAHVDGRHDLNMLGRYVNDNGDRTMLNAEFDKLKPERRALVRALRPLVAGEEVFASYGEGYWRVRGAAPAAVGAGRRARRLVLRAALLGAPLLLALLRARRT
jgi:hypothetical protein